MKITISLAWACLIACASPQSQETVAAARPAAPAPHAVPAETKSPPSSRPPSGPRQPAAAKGPASQEATVTFSYALDEGERSIPMPVRCMYDVKQDRYRNCLSESQGRCQNFGAPCGAEGKGDRKRPCLYDSQEDRYRECSSAHAGRCLSFTPRGCSPVDDPRACVYNARADRYQRCNSLTNGKCMHYAEPCRPEQTPE